jgi:hypothetical protein
LMRTFNSVVEALHKHQHGRSHSVYACLVWNVVCEHELHHFHRPESAGSTRPQWLPSSRPICSLVCAPVYIEARIWCSW